MEAILGCGFRHKLGLLALAGVLLVVTLARAKAQTTLIADAHVSSAAPTVNSGALSNLNVGSGYTALVQFDLSLLPAGTTSAQVSRAVLRLYCNRVDAAGSVSVAAVSSAWAEYGVTFSTMPAFGSALASVQVGSAGQYVSFDVTSAVQSWVAGSSADFGLALSAPAATSVQFDSKENDLTGHPAELQIVLAAGGAGTVGAQGPTGATGATGAVGPAGMMGAQGPAGVPGPQGAAGATGSVGATGPAGANGAAGSAGAAGPQGLQGPAGAMGAQGVPGQIGYTGAAGAMGAPGPVGPQGATGAAGPFGPIGPPGEKGDAGAQGIAGQAGAQGIPGAAGATGLQGPMGPQGVAGPVGLNFRGGYDAATNYALADGVLWQGSGWVSLVASNHGNTPDSSPTFWARFAAQGSVGPAGVAGAVGATGAQGLTGMQGLVGGTGATGTTGAQGLGINFQGSYASTTNYALNDAVSFAGGSWISLLASNHGNTPDASPAFWGLLAAQGVQGVTGTAGLPGANGATGAVGPAGSPGATGPQGAKGDAGLQGPAGAQGLSGAAGAKGDTGAAGPQGLAGQAGAQGLQGVSGATGLKGDTGAQGVQGPQGVQGATGAAGPIGVNFRAAWTSGTHYAVNDAVTYNGATYLAQSSSNNVQPDSDASAWAVLAQAGGAGPTGAAASVSIGTVTTLAAGAQATVTNSGSATSAVLNFALPQGAQGAQGAVGAAGSGGTSAGGGSFAAMYHQVSFATSFYSLNTPNASASESASVLAWVPKGCTAVRLDVSSLQSNDVTVTLRTGATTSGLVDTALACRTSAGSCSLTLGTGVAVVAGSFLDLSISGASGTPAGVWTAVECD